jgi:hypothetical protein
MNGFEVIFNGMTSVQNFIKITLKVKGYTQTGTEWLSHKSHLPL